jgi:putative ABC transport system substrate-binding protein
MRRRQFIAGLGSAMAWPLATQAQQTAMPVIGLLMATSREANLGRLAAFREGLSRTGYVEMRNVAIEYRSADGQYERLPALAAELVRRHVNVIVAGPGIPAAMAAKSATTTIPVVFQSGADPVETGLVANLAQPGGNMIGVTNLDAKLGPKQLEILHELMPMATSIVLPSIRPTRPPRPHRKTCSGSSPPRAAAPCRACEHRQRPRYGVRNLARSRARYCA